MFIDIVSLARRLAGRDPRLALALLERPTLPSDYTLEVTFTTSNAGQVLPDQIGGKIGCDLLVYDMIYTVTRPAYLVGAIGKGQSDYFNSLRPAVKLLLRLKGCDKFVFTDDFEPIENALRCSQAPAGPYVDPFGLLANEILQGEFTLGRALADGEDPYIVTVTIKCLQFTEVRFDGLVVGGALDLMKQDEAARLLAGVHNIDSPLARQKGFAIGTARGLAPMARNLLPPSPPPHPAASSRQEGSPDSSLISRPSPGTLLLPGEIQRCLQPLLLGEGPEDNLSESFSFCHDPDRSGIPADPFGNLQSSVVAVPPTATTNNTRRYLIRLLEATVPEGMVLLIKSLRQAVLLGPTPLPDESGTYPLLIEQTSPFWHFPDGAISWHLTSTHGTSQQTLPAPPPPVQGTSFDYEGDTPGVLAVPGHSPSDLVYIPPASGMPPGNALGRLGAFADIRFPWSIRSTWDIGLRVRGPSKVYFCASVYQTNIATSPKPPDDVATQPFMRREDQFVSAYNTAVYRYVGGAMLSRLFSTKDLPGT